MLGELRAVVELRRTQQRPVPSIAERSSRVLRVAPARDMPGPNHKWRFSFLVRGRLRLGLLSGVALAAVAATIALLLDVSTNPPPAYALTVNANGTITVTFHDLATAIPAVNAKFRHLGIHETVIPITPNCHSVGGPPGQHADPHAVAGPGSMSNSFTYSRQTQRPAPAGFEYVLAAKQLRDGKIEL